MKIEDNIKKIIGEKIGNIIIDRLNIDVTIFKRLSDKEIYKIVHSLCNYVDSNLDITYDDIMDINISEINTIWQSFLKNYKKNYNTSNYVEKNKIILDYRINGIGFYWVDLEKLFCI